MMKQIYDVDTRTAPVRDNKGVAVTTKLVSVHLLQHGVPVAEFKDVALAHQCAELLNKN